jgi:hypothetical protein
MRYATAALVSVALLIPQAFVASTPGLSAPKATDFSSVQKKKQVKKQKDEENLKSAPTAPPKGQSTY